jgi:hypothetical protein
LFSAASVREATVMPATKSAQRANDDGNIGIGHCRWQKSMSLITTVEQITKRLRIRMP